MKNYIKIKNDTQNMTALIKEISENIKEDCDNIIEFEKGTYNFKKEFSEKFPIYASSTKNGENHVIFNFSDNKNITINGNGSEFVFCDRVQPFMFTNCENITLKNFSTDYSFLRYAYAEVIEVLDDGIHIFINNNIFDYYVNDDSLCFVCGEEILSTATRKISIKRLYPEKSGVVFLYAGYTLTDFNGAAPNIFCNVEKTEQGVFLKYSSGTQKFDFKPGDIICLAYDNDREAQMFFFENSKNIVLENVSVYRNGGMVFVADLCEDILIDNLKIQIKEIEHRNV